MQVVNKFWHARARYIQDVLEEHTHVALMFTLRMHHKAAFIDLQGHAMQRGLMPVYRGSVSL